MNNWNTNLRDKGIVGLYPALCLHFRLTLTAGSGHLLRLLRTFPLKKPGSHGLLRAAVRGDAVPVVDHECRQRSRAKSGQRVPGRVREGGGIV